MSPALNPFYWMAGLYACAGLLAAALTGLGTLPGAAGSLGLSWLRVHLITVGVVTQIVFGTLPGVLARRLGVPQGPGHRRGLEWLLLNLGFALLLVGKPAGDRLWATLGAVLVLAAVAVLLQGLLQTWRRSGQPTGPGLRLYLTAPWFLLTGITLAVALFWNWPAPGGRDGILEAHIHANVWGFVSLMFAGTLLNWFPHLVGRPLAAPGWAGPTYWLLTVGAAILVAAPWLGIMPLMVGGLLPFAAGTLALVVNLLLTARAAGRWPPAAAHILLAYGWVFAPALFAPLLLLAGGTMDPARVQVVAVQGLINGWVLGVAMGAAPAVLGGHGPAAEAAAGPAPEPVPAAGPGSWLSVWALNLGVALIWVGILVSPAVQAWCTGAGYAAITMAWVPFVRAVWRSLSRA